MRIHTKIMLLIVSLVSSVAIIIASIFAYLETRDIYETLGDKALSTAVHIANSETVIAAYTDDNPSLVLQAYAERFREETGAEFVVIGNDKGIRLAHPDYWKIGQAMVGGDNDPALKEGESYISRAEGTRENRYEEKLRFVLKMEKSSALFQLVFLIQDVHAAIWQRIGLLGIITLVIVSVAAIGSLQLSRSIRKDMYGLEPFQIAGMYDERQATLAAIREGVIAVDADALITTLNDSAKKLLGISGDVIGKPIDKIIEGTQIQKVLSEKKAEYNRELTMRGRVYIVNREPIMRNEHVRGAVCTFRDKTEMIEMANTLSDIKKYSDDLRAQNHEFTNKLYAISGYLHLGFYEKAERYIEEETTRHDEQGQVLTTSIKDATVQAILMGKAGRASELKVTLRVDPTSHLDTLPNHMGSSQIISILGNVIDNALEAALVNEVPQVSVFITDIGDDVVFEVSDNGAGLPTDFLDVTKRGFSTKGRSRGFGLSIVEELVSHFEGWFEHHSLPEGGSLFSIYLPKTLRGESDD
ncbi:LOW QUALITY PROTEIN: two-component sensor histidine kinase [Geomicrobium sp. JCM 19055]|nr:LOW QUALITY PROTEIN: two-component sensor histidine kinase [Geomicrobium sp. JCM 19055]